MLELVAPEALDEALSGLRSLEDENEVVEVVEVVCDASSLLKLVDDEDMVTAEVNVCASTAVGLALEDEIVAGSGQAEYKVCRGTRLVSTVVVST